MGVTVPRIEPGRAEVVLSRGRTSIAEVALGGTPRGAVLVLAEPGRLGLEAVEVQNGLAEHGYASLAADLAAGPDPAGDLGTLLERLAGRGWAPEQIGVLGYGAGGRDSLLAAARFELGAAIGVSPATGPDPAPVRTPWLGLFGGADPDRPPDVVRRLTERLAGSPVHVEIVTYPGVDGRFHRDGAGTAVHAACFDSWQRTVEWLHLRVAPCADGDRPVPHHTTSES